MTFAHIVTETALRIAALVVLVLLASVFSGMVKIVKQQNKIRAEILAEMAADDAQFSRIHQLERANRFLVDSLMEIADTYFLHERVDDILDRARKFTK